MADEPTNNGGTPPAADPNGNGSGAAPGGNGHPQNTDPNAGGGQNPDNKPLELTPEQLAAAFQHPRFKELNEKAKKADDLEAKAKADAEQKAKDDGKWQEIATAKEQEAKAATDRANRVIQDSNIKVAALQAGVIDADAALALIDRSKIQVDENGNVTGLEDAIKSLVESKPYLVNKSNGTTRIGSGSNPGGTGDQAPKRFKASQLTDTKFFRENEKEIMEAMKNDLIENDL